MGSTEKGSIGNEAEATMHLPCRASFEQRRCSMRRILIVVLAAAGLSVAAIGSADAQRTGVGTMGRAHVGGHVGVHSPGRAATARTRTAFTARAQVRGPA